MTLSVATPQLTDSGSPHAWRLPSRAALQTYLLYAGIIGALFVVGYGGANWLAAQGESHARLYFPTELAIPLWPEMIWVYLSINLLFVLPVFALDVAELRLLGRRMIAGTLSAVAVFLALPTSIGFDRLALSDGEHPAFALLYALDHPFNGVPSLHVTYSALLVSAIARRSQPWLRAVLAVWLLLIIASTLLTHQHHLADIFAALLLVAALHLVVTDRSAAPLSSLETDA
jgi:membrane-associated phospholipid phosphatase